MAQHSKMFLGSLVTSGFRFAGARSLTMKVEIHLGCRYVLR